MAAKKKASKRTKNKAVSANTASAEIGFHYLKGNSYRSVHADGFIGGITPAGKIHMATYSERNPIPRVTYHPVANQEGIELKLDPEILDRRESLHGIIRELEVGIYLDLDTARNLRIWLDDKIKIIETKLPGNNK